MKKNNNLPITNKHLWDNKLNVSLHIPLENNRSAIKEIFGINIEYKYVFGEGERAFFFTNHSRYGDDSHFARTSLGNHVENLEGITIRWEKNPFKIEMGTN